MKYGQAGMEWMCGGMGWRQVGMEWMCGSKG